MAAETPRRILFCCITMAIAGCETDPATRDSGAAVITSRDVVAASPPVGFGEPSEPLYELDTTTAEHRSLIAGDAQHVLLATLADPLGRREIRYANADRSAARVIATADWNLPPTAAVTLGGATAVCWNTLTGTPSRYTRGAMPEPARGMLLRCRVGMGETWSEPVVLQAPTAGVWLREVVARQDGGFSIHFVGDDGWIGAPARPGHGVYEAVLRGGRFGEARLVVPAGDGEP